MTGEAFEGSATLFATDLDRTIIYSRRAAGRPVDSLEPVERYQGEEISFISPRQRDQLDELDRSGTLVVPVTTRTRAQYERVGLWSAPRPWAVCANGGILLDHGAPDPDWSASVLGAIGDACEELAAVASWLAVAAGAWIDHVRIADGLFLYSLVDRASLPASAVVDLGESLEQRGWVLSVQGRKLYAVPHPLRKSAAVREIARRTGAGRVVAAGDSLLDRDLLDDADVSLRPAHGELHEIGAVTDVVTGSSGLAAGEELLALVIGLVSTQTPSAGERSAGSAVPPVAGRSGSSCAEAFTNAGGRVPADQRAPAVRARPA